MRQAIAGLAICLFLHRLPASATLWWDRGANNSDWGASYQSGGQNYAQNWSTASTGGVDPLSSDLSGNRFVFNVSSLNSSQTINLNADRNTGNLQFLSPGAVTINSGSGDNLLTIQGGAMPDVVGAPGAPGVVGVLVDTNAGLVTLNSRIRIDGNQDWRTRDGRSLAATNEINLQTYDLTVTGQGNSTFSGQLFGSGRLIKNEAGTLTLSGVTANTFTGDTLVNGGTLLLSKAYSNYAAAITGNAFITSGGTIRLGEQGQIGDGFIQLNGGTLDMASHDDTVGELIFINGLITGVDGSQLGRLSSEARRRITSDGNSTIQSKKMFADGNVPINVQSGTLTISSIIENFGTAASLTKSGSGTLVLSGGAANTFTGPVTVNQGTLVLNKQLASTTYQDAILGDVTINSGAALRLDHSNQLGDGKITISGGTFNMQDFADTVGELVLTDSAISGTLNSELGRLVDDTHRKITSNGASVISAVRMFADGNVPLNVQSGTLTINSQLDDFGAPMGVTKDGAGTLLLTGTSTYTGGTVINSGTLQGNTQNIRGNVTNNAGVVINQNFDGVFSGAMSGSGTLYKDGAGVLYVTGMDSVRTVVRGQYIEGTTSNLLGDIELFSNTAVVFNQSGSGTYSQNLSGGGYVVKHGTGVIGLTGSNSFSGGTVIEGGGLLVGQNSLGTGRITLNGGTLFTPPEFNGNAPFQSALPITIGPSGGTIDPHNNIATFAGTIDGVGGLTRSGNGILVLKGVNTYSGGTNIYSGTLVADGHGGSAGTFAGGSTVTINSGATLQLNGVNSLGYYSGAPILWNNGGTITTDGSATHSNLGVIHLNGGTLTAVGNGDVPQLGNFILSDSIYSEASNTTSTISANRISLRNSSGFIGGTFDVADGPANVDLTISSSIINLDTDSGHLTKNGAGTLVFSGGGVNTYSGGTVVNQGTLVLDRATDGATQAANDYGVAVGNLTINVGATVRVNQNNQIKDGATVTIDRGTLEIMPAASEAVQYLAISNANITGGGDLGLKSPGNTMGSSGNSTISVGRVLAQSANGEFNIDIGSGALTIQSPIQQSNNVQTLKKWDVGELKLNGVNTYTGGTVLNAGTLTLGNAQALGSGPLTINGGSLNSSVANLTNANNNAQVWAGNFAFAGSQNLNLGTGAVTLNANATININASSMTVGGAISAGTGNSITKNGDGTLVLAGTNTYSGGTTVNGGRLAVNGSIMGPVTINANGTLGGNGAIHGAVAGDGKVAPGNSPGILTIDGNYTQSASSTLEIEFGGTTPGPTGHDKLIVGGTATLAGRLEVPIINNFHPQVDDEITFLTASTVVGQFSQPVAPNLASYNSANQTNLAFLLVYGGSEVKLRVIPRTDNDFVSVSQSADWSNTASWATNSLPKESNRITIENLYDNNPNTQVAQTVNVNVSAAATNELHIADATDPITVRVLAGNSLTTQTDVMIADHASVELQAGSHLTAAAVKVQNGGLLAGNGTVSGRLEVQSGTLRPGFSVGQLDVTGDYEQSSSGTLLVDIESATQHDTLTVTGEAQLDGTLQIDTSQLTTVPTAGTLIPLVTADSITGNFASIEATGNNNVYFLSKIIASGTNTIAYAESFDRGDMNGDTAIDDTDYDLFAFGLMNRSVEKYFAHCQSISPSTSCDISPQAGGDFSHNGRLDFDDLASFQSQLSGKGLSSAALLAAIDRYANNVPEPTTGCIIPLLCALLLRRGRCVYDNRVIRKIARKPMSAGDR